MTITINFDVETGFKFCDMQDTKSEIEIDNINRSILEKVRRID